MNAPSPSEPGGDDPPGGGPDDRYLPGLDGLRAVAVLAVVVFHGGATWFPGGFLGVDLFFVISGYLITSLLLAEWDRSGTIALQAFWGRRFRRLLPALLLVLVAVAAYAALFAEPVSVPTIRWDALSALGYATNWRFIFADVGYFAEAAAPSPVRHLWSLAVEEQWYLVFPPTLILLLKRGGGRRVVVPVLALLTGASFALMTILAVRGAGITRLYEGTDTRAGVILVGALLAAWRWGRPLPTAPGHAIHWVGVAALVASLGFMLVAHGDDPWLYRVGFFVFAGLAGVLVAAASVAEHGPLGRVLCPAPVRYLGRISYGLYLWHWPVNLVLTPTRVGFGGAGLWVLRAATATAIAALSYELIEQPIRTQRVRIPSPSLVTAVSIVVCGAVLVAGTQGSLDQFSLPARQGPRAVLTVPARNAEPSPSSLPPGVTSPPPVPTDRPVQLGLVGDSAAFSLAYYSPRIEGVDIDGAGLIGCGVMFPATPDPDKPPPSNCEAWRSEWAAGATGKDLVLVMLGAWEVADHWLGGRRLEAGTPAAADYVEGQVEEGVAIIAEAGPARVALLEMPCGASPDLGLGGDPGPRDDPERIRWFNDILRRVVARHPGRVTMVSITGQLCPGGEPRYEADGTVLRDDGTHWNEQSAPIAWRWMVPQLVEAARIPTLPPVIDA